jgi:hypothetical protein
MLMYAPLDAFYSYLNALARLSATPWLLWSDAVGTGTRTTSPSPSPSALPDATPVQLVAEAAPQIAAKPRVARAKVPQKRVAAPRRTRTPKIAEA